ncbi:hypothetical protein CW714_02595 [Methanophagales archaeon]|nr:MAG: hypothetical protein CW714_02595 [Methanophagales archaeon]
MKRYREKDLQEELNKQKEEINELKEENQKLRQEIFGLRASKKRRRSLHTNQKPKKRGSPFGHKGTSRKRPDRADTTIVLELEECPYCGGKLKELNPEVPETIGNRHFGIRFLLYIAYLRYVMNLPEGRLQRSRMTLTTLTSQ